MAFPTSALAFAYRTVLRRRGGACPGQSKLGDLFIRFAFERVVESVSGNRFLTFALRALEYLVSRRGCRVRLKKRDARRFVNFYNDLARDAEEYLRARVPVRTGLMRRRVIRVQNLGAVTLIYSDAMNKKGVEYAQFVARYEKALQDTFERTFLRAELRRVQVSERQGFFGRKTRRASASELVHVRKVGTQLRIWQETGEK